MLSNFKRFIKIKSNWFYVITVFLAIAGFVISFIIKEYYFQVIGGMFALIVIENFFMLINYMDDSKSKTDAIENNVEEIKQMMESSINEINGVKNTLDLSLNKTPDIKMGHVLNPLILFIRLNF